MIKGSYAETFAKNNKIPYINGTITTATVKQNGIRYEYRSTSNNYTIISADKDLQGDIVIPSTIKGKKVAVIDYEAFMGCENILSVKLPKTIKTIGEYAFHDCTSLEAINFPTSLTSIKYCAFYGSKLKSVSLPATIKDLGKSVFGSCKELKEINFSTGFTEIPPFLCEGCSSLSTVTLPNTVKTINQSAFDGCCMTVVNLPSSLSSLSFDAFSNCTLLKQVVIPAGIKEINAAFRNCTSLEKIEIPKGAETIERRFFEGCVNLKEIHIPESIYSIDERDNKPPKSCVIYGKSGSYAENFANTNGCTFVSDGASVLGTPVLSRKLLYGNRIHLFMNKRCNNAETYDYVLTKDINFPTSGKYLFKQEFIQRQDQELDFKRLDKGTYYAFARSKRTLADGQTEYSPWSKAVQTVISTQAPKTPTIKSVTVKGNTVTVTLNKTSGAAGYRCVLAENSLKEGFQQLLEPIEVYYTATSTSTKLTFKNVQKGSYKLLARGYAKQKNGTKVWGNWTLRTAMVKVK